MAIWWRWRYPSPEAISSKYWPASLSSQRPPVTVDVNLFVSRSYFMTGPSSTNSIKRNSWLSFLSSITYNLENYSWRTLGCSPRGDGRGLGEPISSWSQFPYQPDFPGRCWLWSSLRWGRALSSSLWILKPSTVREIVLFRLNNDLSNTFAAQ